MGRRREGAKRPRRAALRCLGRPAFSLAVLGFALAAASPAWAQPTGYDELVRAAIVEYNAGNWAEARLLFERAHAIQPNARTWRGMGLADYERRDYVAAIEELEQALASQTKPLSTSQRKSAERALAQARQYTAIYTLSLPPEASQLVVDGRRVEFPGDLRLKLNPGRHTLSVRDAAQTIEREIVAEAGARDELVFEAATPVHAAPAPSAPSVPPTPPSQPPTQPDVADTAAASDAGGLLWTWVAGGATVALGAASTTFGLLALDRNDEFKSLRADCPGADCRETAKEDAKSQGLSFQLLTNVGLGLTGAAAVATALLYFIESGAPEERANVAIGPVPGGVGVRGQF